MHKSKEKENGQKEAEAERKSKTEETKKEEQRGTIKVKIQGSTPYPSKGNTDKIAAPNNLGVTIRSPSENTVHCYDKIFRDLMEEYPNRNWGVIYQQAWSIILKDNNGRGATNGTRSTNKGKKCVTGLK